MIENYIVQRVLEATDIVDVVSEFVPIKKKGARYIGLCPFHEDRHATNFSVYPAKQCFKCFACEASGDAVGFIMKYENLTFPDAIRWLGKRYGIDVDGKKINTTMTRKSTPPPLPTLYLPDSMVESTVGIETNFEKWLRSLPWPAEQRWRIDSVLSEYKVGATKTGMTIFWQIDETGTARTGHVMRYMPDGHRAKEGYSTDWIHAMLRRSGKYPQYEENRVEMRQTLFGMHLLDKYPSADIQVVESEKTAIFAAIFFGNSASRVWMASCGKSNLTREKLKPIIDRRRVIALIPDKDATEEWTAKMEEIGYKRTYISTAILTLQWKEEDGPKADIADVLLRQIHEGARLKKMELSAKIQPAIRATMN